MKMAAKEWCLREKVSGGVDEELAWRTVDRSNEMVLSQACACQDRWHHRRKRWFICLIIELANLHLFGSSNRDKVSLEHLERAKEA